MARGTIVLKAGGQVGDRTAEAVVAAVRTWHDAGYRVVLVHGGGARISQWLERAQIPVRFVDGRRVTDEAALEVVEMVLSANLNKAWVAALAGRGLRAVGLSGRDGGLLTAVQRDDGAALGRVGRIRDVRPEVLDLLLDAGIIPVVSPISQDEQGQALNINADEAAAAVASGLAADLLLLLTDVPGLLADPSDPNSLLPLLDGATARELLASPSVAGGMRPKLEAALAALDAGVPRVHLLDGTDPTAVAAAVERLLAGAPVEAWPGTTLVAKEPIAASAPEGAAQAETAPTAATAPGPVSASWIERGQAVLMNNYGRLPLVLA
ncbi:MAG TPA: acetylglutamate kinase, partial [Bacillota bacterium]